MFKNLFRCIIILFFFNLECLPNYYGSDCNTPCGQCRGDIVCNNVTGQCPYGCKPYWTGPKCDGRYKLRNEINIS